MKNTNALMPAFFLVVLALSGCGKLQTERTPFKAQWPVTATGQPLDSAQFQALCAQKPGQLLNNGTACRFETFRHELSQGAFDVTEASDANLTQVLEGSVIDTQGSVSSNAVEILLNGNRLMAIPQSGMLLTTGGSLAYRFRPGRTYGVKVYVYSCINSRQLPVRCPF